MKQPTPKEKLTDADKRHLAACPDKKWFTVIDVYPKVKRGDYSLGRLVKAGFLDEGYYNGEKKYIKVSSPSDVNQ